MGLVEFDIAAEADLESALKLAFQWPKTVTHYRLEEVRPGVPRMILGQSYMDGAIPFPAKFGPEAIQSVIIGFLQNANYGIQPDCDGHNSKGWRLHNRGLGFHGAEMAIEPFWVEYHK